MDKRKQQNVSTKGCIISKIDMKISRACAQFSLIWCIFSHPPDVTEKPYSSASQLKLGGKKAIFDFLSFGISSSPSVLSDIKVNFAGNGEQIS